MRRILAALILLAVSLPLFATEPNPTARQRELVLQLLDLTNSDKLGNQMIDAMFAEMQKQFVDSVPDEKARAEATEMFELMRVKAVKMNLASMMDETSIRIYSKYFNETELADLIAFYGTPTGKKTIEVMPQLIAESMGAAMKEIGPKMEQILAEVKLEQDKRRPWRRTMNDLSMVGMALEDYVEEHELYPAGDYASLKTTLADYLMEFPEKDIWDHAYVYVVSPDRKHYRLASAGADSIFDWETRRIVVAKEGTETAVRYRERLEDDAIYADGEFVQLPVQAKAEREP
jgi:uncharacterized protein